MWYSHGPSNWFFLNLNHCAQGCYMSKFTLLGLSCSPFFQKWPKYCPLWLKYGPHMVLKIGSPWNLINVPRDVACQFYIAGCILKTPFLEIPKTWPFYGQNMVLKIDSSWILIIEPRDVACQITHCWVYPVDLFPRNGKNMALLWPKYGPHMVLKISSSLILINVPRDVPCQNSHFWVYPVAPFPRNGQNMSLLWPKHGPHIVLQIGSSWFLIIKPRDVPFLISH